MSNDKKKSKLLFGKHYRNIENGDISIPWLEEDTIEKPLFYSIIQRNDRKMILVYEGGGEYAEYVDDICEVTNDCCQFDKNSKWILPKSILEIFGDEKKCVWLGVGDHVELYTVKSLEEETKKIDLEKLKGMMSKLGF